MANTIKLTNNTAGDILIKDLGFILDSEASDLVLPDYGYKDYEIRQSTQLQAYITATDITAKDENDDTFTNLAELKFHYHYIDNNSDLFSLERIGIRNCPLFVFKSRLSGIYESWPVSFIRNVTKLT